MLSFRKQLLNFKSELRSSDWQGTQLTFKNVLIIGCHGKVKEAERR